MTRSDTPQPPDDPEQEGIPSHADDTSTAYDEADRPRFNDSPPPLPADRPLGVDEVGVTAAEQRRGESLADQLAREEPDVSAEDRRPSPEPGLADEVVTEATEAQAARDAEALGDDAEALGDTAGPGSGPGSGDVSDYDLPESGGPVGRLVEPDEGARTDAEKDAIAVDQGEAGGQSAEEAAMHEITDDEVPYER
jgi:hypothetical protein